MKDSVSKSALQFLLRIDLTFLDFWHLNSLNDLHKKKLCRILSLENTIVGSIVIQDETICKAFKRNMSSGCSPQSKRRKADASKFCSVPQSSPTFADFTSPTVNTPILSSQFSQNPRFRTRQFSDKAESESECPSSLEVESGTHCTCISNSDSEQRGRVKCRESVSEFQHDVCFAQLNVNESERISSSEESDCKFYCAGNSSANKSTRGDS